MRGLVYHQPGQVSVEILARETLGHRDVRLAIEACGVCGSDLSSFRDGHYIESGQVMGHEIAAVVAEVGTDLQPELSPGQRVAVRPMRSCGACGYCLAGDTHLCGHTYGPTLGYGAQGGFAEQLVMVDVTVGVDLFPVAERVDPLDIIWAEPLAVALHALGLTGAGVGRILVIGAGAVGLAVVAAAKAEGMAVDVVEPLDERRAAARRLGAGAFPPGEVPHTKRYEAALDASGAPEAITDALEMLYPGAPVVLVGLSERPVPWPSGDHRFVGAFAYRGEEFAAAVAAIDGGGVQLGDLVTHTFGLNDGALALNAPSPGDGRIKAAVVIMQGPRS